jgi:hypothetical protein
MDEQTRGERLLAMAHLHLNAPRGSDPTPRPLEAITRGTYRCACGKPAAFRIVHPERDITLIAPCYEHLVTILVEMMVDDEMTTAPRLQGVVH